MDELDNRSWFKRNWKWAVPTGGCLIIIVLLVIGAGTLFVGVTSMMKESTPYEAALTAAQSNEQVIEALGEPIETHGMMRGNISFSNDDGSADMNIPITGPKGDAKLYVVGEKTNGVWTYEKIEVVLNSNGETIPLEIKPNTLE